MYVPVNSKFAESVLVYCSHIGHDDDGSGHYENSECIDSITLTEWNRSIGKCILTKPNVECNH